MADHTRCFSRSHLGKLHARPTRAQITNRSMRCTPTNFVFFSWLARATDHALRLDCVGRRHRFCGCPGSLEYSSVNNKIAIDLHAIISYVRARIVRTRSLLPRRPPPRVILKPSSTRPRLARRAAAGKRGAPAVSIVARQERFKKVARFTLSRTPRLPHKWLYLFQSLTNSSIPLFCTFLHSSKMAKSLFSIHCALLGQKHPGVGVWSS